MKHFEPNPPVTRRSRAFDSGSGRRDPGEYQLPHLGHKIYLQDIVRSLDEAFGRESSQQTNPALIEAFLRTALDYPANTFDGVLLWDPLQLMGPALLAERGIRPSGQVFNNRNLERLFGKFESGKFLPHTRKSSGDYRAAIVWQAKGLLH